MTSLNYQARAELYLGRDRETAAAQGPRAFATAAKAIRFALEEAAPVSLHGARLQVGEATFSGSELTALYRSRNYPLPRKSKDSGPWRPRLATGGRTSRTAETPRRSTGYTASQQAQLQVAAQ